MTKEEYVASIRELEEIITKYREQEKRLKEQYINENKGVLSSLFFVYP